MRYTRSGRRTTSYAEAEPESEFEEEEPVQLRRSSRVSKSLRDFVASDDEEEDDDADYAETIRQRHVQERAERARRRENLMNLAASRSARRAREEADATHQSELPSSDEHEEPPPRSYSFRERKKINYSLVAPPEPPRDGFGRRIRRGRVRADSEGGTSTPTFVSALTRNRGWDALPLTMTGKDYAHAFNDPTDSSDEEPPRALAPGLVGNTLLENGPMPTSIGTSTDSLGRVHKEGDLLADVDPLGVRMDIDFTHVGGLDEHVQQLKEMVSLPLLYPEVFQRFCVTPPRGVLFHGPPGTGKTLVARALAASCSNESQKISFFMRKGADCLSKWVGEAERQLRLLFDEAKKAQPSIIFFDEIDGLAPVRSSKQDQIHSSIVSTLLALMDGMDGRGQVVVIGATNRPDSVDPALRRPGRFDREFYFSLPNRAARRSILSIHTRGWDPPPDPQLLEVLADATNGYGGADLRALCTEATLNAIQRRYPQIYSTTERLLLEPASIVVDGRDFLLALDKIVPSSTRSSARAAAPLPAHLVPLLGVMLDTCTRAARRLLPPRATRNALEEALWEDALPAAPSSASSLERELLQQSFVQSQVYRPRLVLHGAPGLGQQLVADALLHALDGYHVQSLSVAGLLGDSTQTPEAALVQHIQEAKRLVPSVLYVPELDRWAALLPESVRQVFAALLDSLRPSDPIMLLAVSAVPFFELPPDVRALFGFLPQHRVAFQLPTDAARRAYLQDVAVQAARPPTQFADAVPRRKRVLEELPKAPPPPPRQATQVELKQQADNDARLLEHLKFRLGPVLAELRKKFKKFTRDVWDEYNLRELMQQFDWRREKGKVIVTLRYARDEIVAQNSDESDAETEEPTDVGNLEAEKTDEQLADETGVQEPPQNEGRPATAGEAHAENDAERGENDGSDVGDESPDAAHDAEATAYTLRDFTIYTMNLEKMQKRLYNNGYLTCDDFMADIQKIVANAEEASEVDADRVFRARQMQNLATVLIDQFTDPAFRAECAHMSTRVLAREAEARRLTEEKKATEVYHRRPNGVRYSARQQGEAPEPHDLIDVSTIERENKRARSRSISMNEGSTSEAADPAKRARIDESDEATSLPAPPETMIKSPPLLASAELPPPKPPGNPSPFPATVLDEAAQARLIELLMTHTCDFTVEQLEQVRSACYERILAHCASWDRSALVQELDSLTRDIRACVTDEHGPYRACPTIDP